jgi:hypothetical protein
MATRIAIFCWPADSQHRNASDAALAYLLRADEAGEAIDLWEIGPQKCPICLWWAIALAEQICILMA